LAATAAAQGLSDYLGPGILTRGAGNIGTRSGEQVSLRLFAGVNGIYDNGIEPLSVSSKGTLTQVKGLEGVEGNVGAYGVHSWKQAQLGLDYIGDFRHYSENSFYDGSDHRLALGLTYEKSKRLYFDIQEVGGTYSYGFGGVAGVPAPIQTQVGQSQSLLFDARNYFNQTSFNATYLLSARTSVTVGGQEFLLRFQNSGLVGMNGYSLNGSLQHRISRRSSIGVSYSHMHYDYPGAFGQSDIDIVQGIYSTQFGRRWTFSLQAGGYQAQVEGIQSVALDPSVAAILGISSLPKTFSSTTRYPTGSANLARQFKKSNLSFAYARTVYPGNGVYLTSRNETSSVSYSYTGVRKASFSITGSEYAVSSIGQGLQSLRSYDAAAGFSYALTRILHLTGHYDIRHQDISFGGFRRTSDRAALGLTFSTGQVPLSLW